jgi:hypothetical protein
MPKPFAISTLPCASTLDYANRARAKRALGNISGATEDRKKAEELKEETN